MITRQQYMQDSENLHQAYYAEIAQEARLTAASLPVSLDIIRDKLKTDQHLNNIPLGHWDARAAAIEMRIRPALKARGSGYSLSDGVCTLKALARALAHNA